MRTIISQIIFHSTKSKHPLLRPASCCWSVTQLCPALWDSMDCSIPGLPVFHHLLKFAQVHIHCISDAIKPSHPLTPSSPSALNLSQHQGLLQRVGCSHQMTKKYWSFSFSISPPNKYAGLISLKMGKQWKQWQTLFFGAPKSLKMVTAAMKLKDAYSLEGKLWPT